MTTNRNDHSKIKRGRGIKGASKLTALQMGFVDEFMKDRAPGPALERTTLSSARGDAAKSYAAKLMNHPGVKAEIDRRDRERTKRVDINSDDILRELKSIAFFNTKEMFDPLTKKFRADPFDMDEDTLRALVNFDIVVLNKDGDYIVKAQPGNKLKALEMLGKYKKLFTDKVEVTQKNVKFTTDFDEPAPAEEDE